MSFTNQAVAGQTLVYPAIESPNYVAGSTGWHIDVDGSAEFNDVAIRGDLAVGDANGAAAGTTPAMQITTTVPPEINAFYGGTITSISLWRTPSGRMMYLATDSATNVIYRGVYNPSEPGFPVVTIEVINPEAGTPSYAMTSMPALVIGDGADPANDFGITYPSAGSAEFNGANLYLSDGFTSFSRFNWHINGVNQGQGLVSQIFDTTSSGNVTTEAVIFTLSSVTFKDGRAYGFEFGNRFVTSGASQRVRFRIRKTNAAGTLYVDFGEMTSSSSAGTGSNGNGKAYCYRATGAGDLTANVVLTMVNSTGGGATASQSAGAGAARFFRITDEGDAADFSGAQAIT